MGAKKIQADAPDMFAAEENNTTPGRTLGAVNTENAYNELY